MEIFFPVYKKLSVHKGVFESLHRNAKTMEMRDSIPYRACVMLVHVVYDV